MKYGIANLESNTGRLTVFTNAVDLGSFALIFLKGKFREEGIKFNADGIKEYIEGWVEWANECNDEDTALITDAEQVVDTAADTLTYSNVHLQKLVGKTWEPLSSEEKEIFSSALVAKLSQ